MTKLGHALVLLVALAVIGGVVAFSVRWAVRNARAESEERRQKFARGCVIVSEDAQGRDVWCCCPAGSCR